MIYFELFRDRRICIKNRKLLSFSMFWKTHNEFRQHRQYDFSLLVNNLLFHLPAEL